MIEINHVNTWYGPSFQVLKDCTTSVAKGEVVVVCGPSGSGKSTLIKCVNALEPFQEGQIILDGQEITGLSEDKLSVVRGRKIGFVFQSYQLIPTLTAEENVLLGQPGSFHVEKGLVSLHIPTTVQGVLAARIDRLAVA